MSETILKVGKRGEVFTSEELRKRAKIRKGGRVRATVVEGKLIIEPIPTVEDLIGSPILTTTVKEAESLSQQAQKEEGVYG